MKIIVAIFLKKFFSRLPHMKKGSNLLLQIAGSLDLGLTTGLSLGADWLLPPSQSSSSLNRKFKNENTAQNRIDLFFAHDNYYCECLNFFFYARNAQVTCSDKAFKGTVVKLALPSFNEGSLKIMLTVPFKKFWTVVSKISFFVVNTVFIFIVYNSALKDKDKSKISKLRHAK